MSKEEVLGRTNRLLLFHTTRTSYKTARPTILLLFVCIRCRGNVFTEPLPSNDTGATHTDTQTNAGDL
jgi:hypothetical protein